MAFPIAHNSSAADAVVALAQAKRVSIHVQSQPRGHNVQIVVDGRIIRRLTTSVRNGTLYAQVGVNGKLSDPAVELFKILGAQASFDEHSQTLTVRELGRQVDVKGNTGSIFVDGEATPIVNPAVVTQQGFEIPLRSVIEALGADVTYRKSAHSMAYISDGQGSVASAAPAVRRSRRKLSLRRAIVLQRSPNSKIASVAETSHVMGTSLEVDALLVSRAAYSNAHNYRAYTDDSYSLDARRMFRLSRAPLFVDVNARSYRYSTAQGGLSAKEFHLNLGERLSKKPVYATVGYVQMSDSTVANIHGFGLGLMDLPTPGPNWALVAKLMYYPSTDAHGPVIAYGGTHNSNVTSYDVGTNHAVGKTAFVSAGFAGDHVNIAGNAPQNLSHSGLYAGFGFALK